MVKVSSALREVLLRGMNPASSLSSHSLGTGDGRREGEREGSEGREGGKKEEEREKVKVR